MEFSFQKFMSEIESREARNFSSPKLTTAEIVKILIFIFVLSTLHIYPHFERCGIYAVF